MKELFTDKKFGTEASRMILTINRILDDYARQGYDLSLRQLYYQLVSRNIVENTERSYKNVGSLVSDARMAGLIDWEMIKDRGRETVQNPHWTSPSQFIENVAPQYRFDLWGDQQNYVEVMVEKQALEGVLEPVCRALDVPFTANKGYSSSSAMYEASKRFLKRQREGKDCCVIYLGDHDPSGIDMSRDVGDRLEHFLKVSWWGPDCTSETNLRVRRIALNMEQVEELNPPENPAKLTDSRAADYISHYGTKSWELDAIEPKQLAQLVTDAINRQLDIPLFERNLKKRDQQRLELTKFAKKFLSK